MAADEDVMVNLRTVKRVLALDLGLDDSAIESCLREVGSLAARTADAAEIPLADALRIIASAESRLACAVA